VQSDIAHGAHWREPALGSFEIAVDSILRHSIAGRLGVKNIVTVTGTNESLRGNVYLCVRNPFPCVFWE
jgi:hypothetical protein